MRISLRNYKVALRRTSSNPSLKAYSSGSPLRTDESQRCNMKNKCVLSKANKQLKISYEDGVLKASFIGSTSKIDRVSYDGRILKAYAINEVVSRP